MSQGKAKESTTNRPVLGDLLLRTLAMPSNANPAGDIFGGWIMSQMDIAGAIIAREVSNCRVVTAAVEGMSFLKPVNVGDVVCCYGKCIKTGHTYMKVNMQLWVKKLTDCNGEETAERHLVTEAVFTYVAVDKDGRPKPLPPNAAYIAEHGLDSPASKAGLQSC